MVKKIQINIGNKVFYTLIAILSIIICSGIVFANWNTAKKMFHSSNDVKVTISGVEYSLQEAIDNNLLGGGTLSCRIKSSLASSLLNTDLACDTGEFAVSGGYDYSLQKAYGPRVSKPLDSTTWRIFTGATDPVYDAFVICCKTSAGVPSSASLSCTHTNFNSGQTLSCSSGYTLASCHFEGDASGSGVINADGSCTCSVGRSWSSGYFCSLDCCKIQ